jgi:hypothetical protein
MYPRSRDLQLAGAALDRAFPGLAITHDQGPTMCILTAVAVDVFLDFGL